MDGASLMFLGSLFQSRGAVAWKALSPVTYSFCLLNAKQRSVKFWCKIVTAFIHIFTCQVVASPFAKLAISQQLLVLCIRTDYSCNLYDNVVEIIFDILNSIARHDFKSITVLRKTICCLASPGNNKIQHFTSAT